MPVSAQTINGENRIARNNTLIYATCQALVSTSAIVNISLGGLAGAYLLDADKSFATAPVTGFNIGVALGAIPAAMMTRWLGRKFGFMVGLVVGIVGLLISTWALVDQNFIIFCFGAILNGVAGGFGQQFRFAAADHGSADIRAKAISWVLVGGIIAAFLGSPIIIFTRDFLLPTQFAGAYLSVSVLLLLAIAVMGFLNTEKSAIEEAAQSGPPARPLLKIVTQPRFMVAALCGTLTYALMTFVMTGAPLAMVASGISIDNAAIGIQWHVLAMFGPSFFTGNLITRFGKEKIVATGMVILILCAIIALSGVELWKFWLSLILLGLGWNFGFIGTTSMVTDTYYPDEKNKAQGANDFILFSSVAFASLMSGFVFNNYGWYAINYIIFPTVILSICALLWLLWLERRHARQQIPPNTI
ncbi:MAG: MFS transporter [Rhizobiaceae bacterium]|nr:MFS transporter [Rhizobiaceae bacterium]